MRRSLFLILIVAFTAIPAYADPPANDDPAGAVAVDAFPTTLEVDTTDASTGPFEETCSGLPFVGVRLPTRAVWYKVQLPAGTESIQISHDGRADVVAWDRITTAPTGDPILSRRGCAYGDDDWPLYVYGRSEIYVSVGSSLPGGGDGPYTIDIEVYDGSGPPPVPNDAPYRATRIASLPYEVEQDASDARYDEDPAGCEEGALVWYSYTPPSDEQIEISVSAEDWDSTVSAYALGDEVETLGCASSYEGAAVIRPSVRAGVPVLIGIGGRDVLTLSVRAIEPDPGPDARAGAPAIAIGSTVSVDATGATLEAGEPLTCGSGGSLWYELPELPRQASVQSTGGLSLAAVAGDDVLACSTTGSLAIPAGSPAMHLQVRGSSAGTIRLGFDPAYGKQVTDETPFEDGCETTGRPQINSEVEVHQTVDPHDPDHLLMAWQQDRHLSGGGARGIGSAVSFDGGETWTNTTIPGVSICSGGSFMRATDPWVSIGADGTAYVMSLSYNNPPTDVGGDLTHLTNALLINSSEDGGLTWSAPNIVAASPGILLNDKETLTADPNTPGLLYAVWNLYPTNVAIGVFARSEDGGKTWTPPTPLPTQGGGLGQQVAVLDDGTLVEIVGGGSVTSVTSYDRGTTWSRKKTVGPGGFTEGPPGVRGGADVPSVYTDGESVFVSWSDTWFTYFSRSDDAGQTWDYTRVAGDENHRMRSTTAVAGTDGGKLAVITYIVGPTDYEASERQTWLELATSDDDGQTWTTRPVTDTFDIQRAPYSEGRGYFLGDYFGLSASGENMVAAFTAPSPGTEYRVSDVYSLTVGL